MAKKKKGKKNRKKNKLVVASATFKLVPEGLLGGLLGLVGFRSHRSRRASRSLGAAPSRHNELAVFHANESAHLADRAGALAKVGKCASAINVFSQATMEYGRADAHTSTSPDLSEAARAGKVTARGAIATAQNRLRGCTLPCR